MQWSTAPRWLGSHHGAAARFAHTLRAPLCGASRPTALHTQVLQIPVIKPKALKRLLAGIGPRPPLLGAPCTPTTDDDLDLLLQRVGSLLGKDPSKWEQTGAQTTEAWWGKQPSLQQHQLLCC